MVGGNVPFFVCSIHALYCAEIVDCEICIDSISLIIHAHHSFRLCQFHFLQDRRMKCGIAFILGYCSLFRDGATNLDVTIVFAYTFQLLSYFSVNFL